MLLDERRPSRVPAAAAGAACLCLIAIGAMAAQSDLSARRLQEEEVQTIARAASRAGFDVPVNDVVLRELAGLVGTAEMRAAVRSGLGRLEARREMVDRLLQEHGVPDVLRAVPLVESRYRSLPEALPNAKYPGPRGAGLWQFIPPTARSQGLRVDGSADERLVPERETAAAARFLASLHQEFGDWPLALAAYNEGQQAVRRAITAGGTRDAWALIRQGRLNPYAGSVMAAALVIQDTRLAEEP